jgi:hypothetical protein
MLATILGIPPLPPLTYGSAGSHVKEKEKKRETENHEKMKVERTKRKQSNVGWTFLSVFESGMLFDGQECPSYQKVRRIALARSEC